MIICANCQHKNVTGAMFCAECGAQLDGVDTLITQAITDEQIVEELNKQPAHPELASTPVTTSWISLHLMDSGKILPLASRNEFTLGRLSEGQPIMPDIDLTPYQAYASGVSRLHAVVKRDASRVLVMDLGSSNGTYVNGRRINPHVEESLSHGDIIALGKLKIQVLLRNI
ncbi:MAG: FHA domain-containing protein [Chloroflexota bacterium]|nr:FHA domain-containing protein [Anaerolineales bacterium]HMB22238.1 FHA domain-containing protein [Anaerolineales bacterium]